MKKILVLDDSRASLEMLKKEVQEHYDINPYYAKNYQETLNLLEEHQGKFHAALLNLSLLGVEPLEIVELTNFYEIPSVVILESDDKEIKELLLDKNIINVIFKNDTISMKFAILDISRTLKNYDTTIMIVDDSKIYRNILKNSLKKIKLNIVEAEDGDEAIELLRSDKHQISLILTDYEMPNTNGLELTFKLREKYTKDSLGIIAISAVEDQNIISKFLKLGANDFINKRFTHNEIVTRVNSNLELLELFARIKEMANKDFLTGAYNRRYFFEAGNSIYAKNSRKEIPMAVAMLDIDKFKNINDTYGHDIGDIAIKEVKKIFDKNLRNSDLMARFGGEEFCVLLEDTSLEHVEILFEKIRKKFEDNIIKIGSTNINYTVSIGIYFGLAHSLEEMIRLSDEALYEAKESGRNMIKIKL
ncbi:MAG: diguanylate cyclase [Sulfurimonas sp.]|uniref:GGDEF domain-containing response regulator n=1 Tax=Sulfurimonas sp. TaxID=2022749 RepID=UPI0025F4F228|nr:diguanylate cyclase [Sulfurimonas sp.]MCK9492091.1 diguanylate cyclase [Sulfurimonas sp.]